MDDKDHMHLLVSSDRWWPVANYATISDTNQIIFIRKSIQMHPFYVLKVLRYHRDNQ